MSSSFLLRCLLPPRAPIERLVVKYVLTWPGPRVTLNHCLFTQIMTYLPLAGFLRSAPGGRGKHHTTPSLMTPWNGPGAESYGVLTVAPFQREGGHVGD